MTKILVADDDRTLLSTIDQGLKQAGYTPTMAETANDAIELMQQHQFDCVITDIHLPGSGYTIIRSVKKYLGNIPTIVITGSFIADDHHKPLTIGADAVLVKPVTLKHIISMIEKIRASYIAKAEFSDNPLC